MSMLSGTQDYCNFPSQEWRPKNHLGEGPKLGSVVIHYCETVSLPPKTEVSAYLTEKLIIPWDHLRLYSAIKTILKDYLH